MMREDTTATAHLRLDEVNDPRARRRREGHARKITLAGAALDYRLIRARRRTIGMEVSLPPRVTVRAPRWVTLSEIEEARCSSARSGRPRRSPEAAAAPRRHAAEWQVGALILYRGPGSKRSARRTHVAPSFNLTGAAHPRAQDESEVAGGKRPRDEARAPLARLRLRGAASRVRRPCGGCRTRAANGKLQRAARFASTGASCTGSPDNSRTRSRTSSSYTSPRSGRRSRRHSGTRRAARELEDWTALLAA